MALSKRSERAREKRTRSHAWEPQRQRAFAEAIQRAKIRTQGGTIGQQPQTALVHEAPGLGELNTTGQSSQQCEPELPLELLHRLADGGLGGEENLGGGGEPALAHNL